MTERQDKLQALRQELALLEAEERSEGLQQPSTLWVVGPFPGPHLASVVRWTSTKTAIIYEHGRQVAVEIGVSAWIEAKQARKAYYEVLQAKVTTLQGQLDDATAAAVEYHLKWGLRFED